MAEATRLIARAASLKPDDAAITDSLGWAFYLRGQTSESIAVLERAVAADPTEAALGEHLGDAYWSAGRRIDARYAWGAALTQALDDDAVSKRITAKIEDGLP
jgi:Flp pilus assembly protein TadD